MLIYEFVKDIFEKVNTLKVLYIVHSADSLGYDYYLPNENFSIACYSPVIKNNIINKFPSISQFNDIDVIPIYSYTTIDINVNKNKNKNKICLVMIGTCIYVNKSKDDLLYICLALKKCDIDLQIFDPSFIKNNIYTKINKKFDNVKIFYRQNNNNMYTIISKYKYKILFYDYKYTDRVSGSIFLSYFLKIPILTNKIYENIYTHMTNIIYYDKSSSGINKYIKLIHKIKYIIDNYNNIINKIDSLKEDNYECIKKLF